MHDLTRIERWDAMAQPGCAACPVAVSVSRRRIRSFFPEDVLDGGMRERPHGGAGGGLRPLP